MSALISIFTNKRLYFTYYFLSLLLMPVYFGLIAMQYYDSIETYQQAYNYTVKVLENLDKILRFKMETKIILASCFIPFLIVLYLTYEKKSKTTYGKAKFAKKEDIERYSISPVSFFKDILQILNYKNYLNIIRFLKMLGSLLPPGVKPINPMDVNFGKGVILGLFNGKEVCYKEPLATLIIAPAGSGKTSAVALPNLLTLKTSCVVLDIKGELCELTAGYRQKELKNKVLIFDPFSSENSMKFNPFDKRLVSKLDFNAKRQLVEEVANTIFAAGDNEKDPHWIQQAKNVFIFYALYDLCVHNGSSLYNISTALNKDYKELINPKSRHYKELYEVDDENNIIEKNGVKQEKSDVDARKLWFKQVADQKCLNINDERNYKTYDKPIKIKEKEKLDSIVRDSARAWSNMNPTEFGSIISTFNRTVNIFTNYNVRDATDSMSFEYEDLRRENITLYIRIAQTQIETLGPLIRVLLESIAKNLLTRESKKESERIYFILDEFVRFGKMEFLIEMPALCRSYGIVPIYITQSYAMIEKYYSKETAQIVDANARYKVVFKCDVDYAKKLAEEVGKHTIEKRNRSTQQQTIVFGGTSSYSEEGVELISAQDFQNIPSDEVIVLITGHKATPLKLKANLHYKRKTYLKRLNWKVDLPKRKIDSDEEDSIKELIPTLERESNNTEEDKEGKERKEDKEGKEGKHLVTDKEDKEAVEIESRVENKDRYYNDKKDQTQDKYKSGYDIKELKEELRTNRENRINTEEGLKDDRGEIETIETRDDKETTEGKDKLNGKGINDGINDSNGKSINESGNIFIIDTNNIFKRSDEKANYVDLNIKIKVDKEFKENELKDQKREEELELENEEAEKRIYIDSEKQEEEITELDVDKLFNNIIKKQEEEWKFKERRNKKRTKA